jgi:hypothetical protein
MANIVDSALGNSSGNVELILGDVVFGHMEVPPGINFGGEQMLVVNQQVGGKRDVNALGRSEHDISWNGTFLYKFAEERSRALDYMRTQGLTVELIWGQFVYSCIVKSYRPIYKEYYYIPYRITVTIIENLTIPVPIALPNSYNDSVNGDFAYGASLIGEIGNAALAGAFGNLGSSISDAGNLGSATPGQLNNIVSHINNCQSINNSIIGGGA